MANVLIVHAHHEPQSFSSALAHTAAKTLAQQGHEVVFSDLYALKFNPVSDRHNFTTVADPTYLKQQKEEELASVQNGFAPDLEAEMQKLEKADLLIFSFPLWWFGLPAILKGWVDRVFAHGRIYSRGRWFENGVGQGKRAMVVMTTGSPSTAYGERGLQPPLELLLKPVHHGTFWFNGFSPLQPFVAWSAAHVSDVDRQQVLQNWQTRLRGLFQEPLPQLPLVADFDPKTFTDTLPRFMVTATRHHPSDKDDALLPAQTQHLNKLRREGHLLNIHLTSSDSPHAYAFLLFRARTKAEVSTLCQSLPLAPHLTFEIVPLDAESRP